MKPTGQFISPSRTLCSSFEPDCCNVISHAGTPTLILPKITYKHIFQKKNTIQLKRVAQNMILHSRSHCSVTLNE